MIAVVLLFLNAFFVSVAYSAENYNIRFSWDAVTTNENDTPCDDLAGYAIYSICTVLVIHFQVIL
jgi:hypothetical protein